MKVGIIQYEDNEKDINDLKLERVSQKAISQNTDSSIQKPVDILKIQNDESTKSEKIEKTEKNIEMHGGAGMDLTMWGPWAQDLVGALLKLRQGDSSTRFVGRYVRNKNMSKKLKIFKSSILCKRVFSLVE